MGNYEKAVKLWRNYDIRTEADIDKYLDSFRVLFAYNSGKIENPDVTYHDTRDIFENSRVNGYSGDPRTLFEQQNQKLCYEYLRPRIVAKEPLTLELVKQVHLILTSGTYDERRYIENNERPGEFKRHDYVTGVHEVGSAATDVEQDLTALIEELNEIGRNNPLKAGAYFHAQFEYIHPFADGNGRTGRTLLNYWLMINEHPPLIVYDEDKRTYYLALQTYDEKENLDPLFGFLKTQTGKTWERSLDRQQSTEKAIDCPEYD